MIPTKLKEIKANLPTGVNLVAVSKTKPNEMILEAYDLNQRIFGENRVQELIGKFEELPKDIEWHLIGHLQRNKVKQVVPFVSLIHAVDSPRLFDEIEKEAKKINKKVNCLLQIHIANEAEKHGFSYQEAEDFLNSEKFKSYSFVSLKGLMGMATFTDKNEQVRNEFKGLNQFFQKVKSQMNDDFTILSSGMSGDYKIAIEEGSNMVRIGSSIFGGRS